jgi:hypothetical protein
MLPGISSIPLGILLCFLCLVLTGSVIGKVSPADAVTVQPFEISPEIGNRTTLSGKSASDIVVDILNDAAGHAAQFHGTDYYRYVGTGAQPVSLEQAIKVPIQTSYGIELKGVSLDNLLHLYDQARYDQWIIGGDVFSSPAGLVARIRLNHGDKAESWETSPSLHASPSELVREAAYKMLQSAHPELLGQSYLQQAGESQSPKDAEDKYVAAEKVFRQWASDDPQNWKPSYYLSLVYGYRGKAQEASNLASWSQTLSLEKRSSKKRFDSGGSDQEIASNLAQTTKVALETNDTSDPEKTPIALHQKLNTLEGAKSILALVFKSKPTNADYLIQRARILDKEATIESELNRNSLQAYEWSSDAIVNLDKAIQRVPENGGLHEQRAILLEHLVEIMKEQRKAPEDIRKKESEEVTEYTRALELRPWEDSPLWGAVYAQIDLHNSEAAVDLARTITVLQPGCTAANAAYIVALERAIKSPGDEPEREKEVGDRLGPFLESNPEKSELLAVLDALLSNKDREHVDLVVAEGKRRFPEDSGFEERGLQNFLAGLLHPV